MHKKLDLLMNKDSTGQKNFGKELEELKRKIHEKDQEIMRLKNVDKENEVHRKKIEMLKKRIIELELKYTIQQKNLHQQHQHHKHDHDCEDCKSKQVTIRALEDKLRQSNQRNSITRYSDINTYEYIPHTEVHRGRRAFQSTQERIVSVSPPVYKFSYLESNSHRVPAQRRSIIRHPLPEEIVMTGYKSPIPQRFAKEHITYRKLEFDDVRAREYNNMNNVPVRRVSIERPV